MSQEEESENLPEEESRGLAPGVVDPTFSVAAERHFSFGFTASSRGRVAESSAAFWRFLWNRHTKKRFGLLAPHRKISWRNEHDYGTPIVVDGFRPKISVEDKTLETYLKRPKEMDFNIVVWEQLKEVIPQYSLRNLNRIEFPYTYPQLLFDLAVWREEDESHRHALEQALTKEEIEYLDKFSCDYVWDHRKEMDEVTVELDWGAYDGFKVRLRPFVPAFQARRVKIGQQPSKTDTRTEELPESIRRLLESTTGNR